MPSQAEHPPDRSATTRSPRNTAPPGPSRGRGTAVNPANRFETISLAQLPPGGGDDDLLCEYLDKFASPRRPAVPTRIIRDRTRSIINPVDSPDLPFRWTINPYRGCEHGCFYCYARPTHEMLGLSCGLDFETVIHAKTDSPDLLRRELAKPSWKGEPIVMSGVTDAYQPVERRLGITRACLEIMADCAQPVSIVTKSALVLRDADLLARLAQRSAARVFISLTTLDADLSAKMEPRASAPGRRLHAIAELAHAGIPVGVMTAPIIPGLNDQEVPALLQAAARAGATTAGYILLRLPWQNKAIFLEWLGRHVPEKASRIESLLRGMRGGALNTPSFGKRIRGEGEFAEHLRRTFHIFARRFGLNLGHKPLSSDAFVRPPSPDSPGQLHLFG